VGNADRSSIHDIWHGPELTRIREIHQRQEGPACLEACNNCYLPLKTAPETIRIGDWSVTAQKYTGGKQQVKELNTPEKHRRDGLEV